MVPKMPDSYLTAGCFCLYSPDREERNGYDRKQMQLKEEKMKIEKKVLNDALRILGKMVCQTSPVEVFRECGLLALREMFWRWRLTV